jgi:Ser/Thr protein kinase RdoA (MazF antagonist)
VPTRRGKDYYKDDEGEVWRVITLIEAASSFERVRDAAHALEAGSVLGCFHRMISDLNPKKFHDTLPGFHVCPQYLRKYDQTLTRSRGEARGNGMAEVDRLHAFVDSRRGIVGVLEDARARGDLGTRLIHGDPKVDNIMIDDFTGKGIGIIDLDTVKPGLIHYDFGDALRSICNPAGEDAADLREVFFDVALCEAFVKGYLREASEFLTEGDRASLYDAIRLITFELGLRFFQDYLAGDVYFKVRFEEHNLNRARVQFKLCESIEANEKAFRNALAAPL